MRRTIKTTNKISESKSKIFAMINSHTGGPGLSALKDGIKSENDTVA